MGDHALALHEPVYEFSRHQTPRLAVASGDVVTVETEDAFTGQIRRPGDRRDRQASPFSDPVSGPIAVDGARPGDALAVEILEIEPLIAQCATYALALPPITPHLGGELVDQTRICVISNGKIHWSDDVVIPYQPMIGTIGTAPAWGSPTTAVAGDHGGNLDLREVRPGATVYLPVAVDGGLLYVGDCHAAQGGGEVCGIGLEMPARIRMKLSVVAGAQLPGPRIETGDEIGAVAYGRPLEDAIGAAYARLALWMEAEHGWSRWEAYALLSHVGEISVGYYLGGGVVATISKLYVNAARGRE